MDISAFRDRRSADVLSVCDLNNLIKSIFDSNRLLSSVSVRGEISNFKAHSSGHLYFSLKDDSGQIRAVMFRGSALSLRFVPENGMRVIATGSVSVYPKDGSYQLYVGSMQPDGIGALYLAYEQLKARLESEGLFSDTYKRQIPQYPARIGVITSPTGAAVRDIINVITRRAPGVEIHLYPALVQGDGAEDSLIKALDYFDRTQSVDIVIIGRGGGSIEDLWAFNGERLARRIFAAMVPIISAVGHQTDFTIADFVADLRAPTPSAAAELAVPDMRELAMRVVDLADRCDNALIRLCKHNRERFENACAVEFLKDPTAIFLPFRDELSERVHDFRRALSDTVSAKRSAMALCAGKLEALSPLAVLSRGYSVVQSGGHAVTDANQVAIGDEIGIRLSHGGLTARIVDKA